MLCSAIITSVQTATGIATADADFYRWINDAVNEASLEAGAKVDVFGPLALTAGVDSYDTTAAPFPADWIRATYLTITSSSYGLSNWPLKAASIRRVLAARQTPVVGVPPAMFCSVGRDRLLLAPVPATGDTMSGIYVKRPTQVAAGGDTPDLPQEYHEAIVEQFVRGKAYELDGDDERAKTAFAAFANGVARLARDVTREAGDTPLQMERLSSGEAQGYQSQRRDLDRGY